MITTVTMNPAFDRTIKVDGIRYGEVNRVAKHREGLGGKGINVGRILNGLGIPTMNLAFIGKENKNEVLDYIRKDGMAFDYVEVEGRTRTNIKIVELDKGITTDLNEEGIIIEKQHFGQFMDKLEPLAINSEFIILSGSLAMGIPENVYGNITRMFKGDSKVVVDADNNVLKEALKGQPYMIKPNIHELERVLERKLEDQEEIIQGAQEIIETYGITYVLVSVGEKGCYLVSSEEVYKAEALSVEVVSTVAAGDAMVAGFVYAQSRQKSIEESIAFGVACSTLNIQREGYPVLDIDDVYDKSRQVVVEKVEMEEL